MESALVGTNLPKYDAPDKVLGRAAYAGDLEFKGMLYGGVFRSTIAHGRIKHLDLSATRKVPGVRAVVTAADIPGNNLFGLAILDQPVLVGDKIRCPGDPIVAIAGDSEHVVAEALKKVRVDYDELPAVFSAVDALGEDSPKVHEQGNLLAHWRIRKGNMADAFDSAYVVVENTYHTQRVDHAYLETEVSVAYVDPDGIINVHTSTQYPFRDRRQIAEVLGVAQNKVRVIEAVTGGGFGGKDDVTTEILAALLAVKSGRPVQLSFSRKESLIGTSKRHPMVVRCKTGATKDGKLTGLEAEIHADTGAYASLGPFVVKKTAVHLAGPYYVPNVKIDAYAVYTNNLLSGPMRGFGVPQAAIVHESQMDMLAEKLGLDPIDFRLQNALDIGLSTATGQVLKSSVGIKETILRAREKANLISLE